MSEIKYVYSLRACFNFQKIIAWHPPYNVWFILDVCDHYEIEISSISFTVFMAENK